jgi:hypothetical protein
LAIIALLAAGGVDLDQQTASLPTPERSTGSMALNRSGKAVEKGPLTSKRFFPGKV